MGAFSTFSAVTFCTNCKEEEEEVEEGDSENAVARVSTRNLISLSGTVDT